MTRPEKLVAILGMHRSGTSCLTGSLQTAGLELGDCHTWNPYNKKGNRENQAFVDLHDDILSFNLGAWDRPPDRISWSAGHKKRAQELLSEFKGVPIAGFKDPRTVLVLSGWKALVPDMFLIGVFRHPAAVVESLKNRSALSKEHALELWYQYNHALYQEYRKSPFPLLCFDEPEEIFNLKIDQVASGLGLVPPCSQRFYDERLKNHTKIKSSGLPWKVRFLYRRLLKVSV